MLSIYYFFQQVIKLKYETLFVNIRTKLTPIQLFRGRICYDLRYNVAENDRDSQIMIYRIYVGYRTYLIYA